MQDISSASIRTVTRISGSGVSFELPADQNLEFSQGRFAVLLGQNGSGKTSFLEAILGIRPDYAVDRSILGSSHIDLPNDIKRRIGVSTQIHSYSEGVKVRDVVRLHAGAYRVAQNNELLETFDLGDVLGSDYAKISGGQKKRLSLYFALAHNPEVVFLDEPEAGLDVQGLEALLAQIRARSDTGLTTIAATHHDLTTEHAGDVMLLNAGEVVFSGAKVQFIDDFFGDTVLEVNTDGLLPQDIERILAVGKANCFDGLSKDKLLVFGCENIFADPKNFANFDIERRSILRKTKSTDLLTWINNRAATKCAP